MKSYITALHYDPISKVIYLLCRISFSSRFLRRLEHRSRSLRLRDVCDKMTRSTSSFHETFYVEMRRDSGANYHGNTVRIFMCSLPSAPVRICASVCAVMSARWCGREVITTRGRSPFFDLPSRLRYGCKFFFEILPGLAPPSPY